MVVYPTNETPCTLRRKKLSVQLGVPFLRSDGQEVVVKEVAVPIEGEVVGIDTSCGAPSVEGVPVSSVAEPPEELCDGSVGRCAISSTR